MMKKGLLMLTLLVSVFTLAACALFDDVVDVDDTTYSLDLSANVVDAPLTFSPATLKHNTEVTVTAASVEGYTFVEWLDTNVNTVFSEEASFTFTIIRDMSLKAIYEETSSDGNDDKEVFVIELSANVVDAPLTFSPATLKHNTEVTVTAASVEGYTFVEWLDTNANTVFSEEASFTFTIIRDMSLKAIYEEEESSEVHVYTAGFNEDLKRSYAEGPVTFGGLTWILDDALLGSLANDQKDGSHSIRLRNGSVLGSFTVTKIEEVSFNIGNYLTDNASVVTFEVSIDGEDWLIYDSQIEANAWRLHTIDFETVYETLDISPSTKLFMRISSSNSNRVNIDDFKIIYAGDVEDEYTSPEPLVYYSVTLSSNIENVVLTANPSDSEIVEGTRMFVSAGALAGYTFKHWEDATTEVVISTESSYEFDLESDVNLRAVYESETSFPNNSTRLELTLDNVDYYYSYGDEWTGASCTVLDLVTDETVACQREGEVDTSALGSYNIIYYAEDEEGKFVSEVVTKIVFRDTTLLDYDYSYNDYYSGLEGLYGDDLLLALREILNATATLQSYGDARYILEVSDEDPNNPGQLLLMYTRTNVDNSWEDETGSYSGEWNREHVWPQSRLGLSSSTSNTNRHIGSDLHNLRAITPSVNSSRGNKYFDYTTTTLTYFPGEDRGDAARTYFYMVTMWEVLTLSDEPADPDTTYEIEGAIHGYLSTLIDFHYDDPVDGFEAGRHEIIVSHQNNRNPFIDYPHLVELIWYDHPNIPLP